MSRFDRNSNVFRLFVPVSPKMEPGRKNVLFCEKAQKLRRSDEDRFKRRVTPNSFACEKAKATLKTKGYLKKSST